MDTTFAAAQAGRRTTALIITIGLHVLLAVGLILGTNRVVVERVFGPVETEIIEEVQEDAEEPPPPPPVVETPPPFVPPPDIVIDVPTSSTATTAITAVTTTRPPPPAPPPRAVVRTKPQPNKRLYQSDRWKPTMPARYNRMSKNADFGSTLIRCYVDVEGRCTRAEILSKSNEADLDETAIKHAVRVWRFTPGTEDGKPVESTYDLKLTWQVR